MISAETMRSESMEVEIAVLSKPGGRKVNEDTCGYWTGGDYCCCVLSDGAGGHGSGDVASKLVVRTILQRFRKDPACSAEAVAAMLKAANKVVLREQKAHAAQAEMRATVAVLIMDLARSQAIWGHLGDSRVYCFRNGALVSQTRDHSVVQSMIDAGYLEQASLRTNPKRSVLTAAIGNADELEPAILEEPVALSSDQVFLLCSDGWWECVEESRMQDELGQVVAPREWLLALEQELKSNARPNHDNYSAIALWLNTRSALFF